MIVLEVKLNGDVVALAGRDDLSVLNAIVDAVGVLGSKSAGTKTEKDDYYLQLSVGGLASKSDDAPGEHLRWVPQRELRVGDEVTVRIMEGPSAENPIKQYSQKATPGDERKQWEAAREFYLKYKDKYGPTQTKDD